MALEGAEDRQIRIWSPARAAFPFFSWTRRAVQLVRCPAHGDLPQGRQILGGKKILQRLLRLALPVNLPLLQPLFQVSGRNVHQFHLVGAVKHVIRDPFVHHDPCDGGDKIVQRFQVLHVYCGIDIDPRLQQLLHILIPLGVAAARGVAVSQFIHQDQLWSARQGSVQVKLPQPDPPVVHLPA